MPIEIKDASRTQRPDDKFHGETYFVKEFGIVFLNIEDEGLPLDKFIAFVKKQFPRKHLGSIRINANSSASIEISSKA